MKLNLGCGSNKPDGYIHIDKALSAAPDVCLDLEIRHWPFDNNSVEHIRAHHILEHLGRTSAIYLAIIQEMYRILIPNGEIEIIVPHWRSDNFSGDPTHVRAITPAQMALFSKKECQKFRDNGWANTPLADYLDIDFDLISTNYTLFSPWSERYASKEITREELDYAVATYNNVVCDITMILRKVKANE